jgi:hypothetical protein
MTKRFFVSISAASLVWCALAHAQQSSPSAKSTPVAAPASAIVVTGSLTISDGSQASIPVTVIVSNLFNRYPPLLPSN